MRKEFAVILLLFALLFGGCGQSSYEANILSSRAKSVESIAFSSDGHILATAGGSSMQRSGVIELWDSTELTRQRTLSGFVNKVIWASFLKGDPERIIIGDHRGEVRILSLDNAFEDRVLIPETESGYFFLTTNTFALSPNGESLAIGDHTGNLKILSLDVPSETVSLSNNNRNWNSLAFSKNSVLLAASSVQKDQNSTVEIFNSAGEVLQTLSYSGIVSIVFSPTDEVLAILDRRGAVRLWNYSDKKIEYEFYTQKKGKSIADFSPDGKFIAVATTEVILGMELHGRIEIWSIEDRKRMCTFDGIADAFSINEQILFSPDGSMVATTEGGKVKVWNVADCLNS